MSAPAGIDPSVYAQALADIRGTRHASAPHSAAFYLGADYVRPGDRPAVWARMAADLAAEGRSVPQIADDLCVTEDTVRALLGAVTVEGVAA